MKKTTLATSCCIALCAITSAEAAIIGVTQVRYRAQGIDASGNGLGLAAFLRVDARIGARRVDECQNG